MLLVWTDGDQPAYFVQLGWDGAALPRSATYRYVPYILHDFAAAR